MEIIYHRRNTLEELKNTSKFYGVEIDIRTYDNSLVISHEPYLQGTNLEDWLSNYNHGTLILNIKEEGLEWRLLELMNNYNINNFFFLDQSFPFLIKTSLLGEKRSAVRVSEYESIETALSLAGKVDWIWVDIFSYFPLTNESASKLKESGFKLCLVSPELQGENIQNISKLKSKLAIEEIYPDAICTKNPKLWL